MKLQLKMPVELANQIHLNISETQRALNHEKMVSIITKDEDLANDIACDILRELMTISPTYKYQDFYTLMNINIEDGEIYFQSDVQDFIDGDTQEQLFYHYMDQLGLLEDDLTKFIDDNIRPLGASLKFIE